ncbi:MULTISPECIES: YneF family protein [Mycoplasma]|uniref:YneF family protein n=2 Tax=Mycoplasma TaxID=2093 RepID=A0A6M4JA59_9MOLU|nr:MULTISPECIES: YneF family protein [Mycoplasma]MBU4689739.1 YneF family protein [Mycoplasma zalophidermidis]MBU4690713.1 YneF family protein [Mycoplasma miroungigenitalium]MBU4691982.1 YneF family protein [Mycoplasma miroungigenitalium]MBU4693749.1 YneF family protein [Mycoplasma zalophidermidis]MCR8966630.1 YneF family protein [Mycoplasma zalophidermidis]
MGLTGWILTVIFCSIAMGCVGGFIGFFIARSKIQKQIKENPPITEKMVRAMFLQMGRKASEQQVRNVMRSIYAAKDN